MLRIYLLNYNYGHYIKEAVSSLLAQTDKDFTVTCIDNGSTDGSNQYLSEICSIKGWLFEQFPNQPISKLANHIARTSDEAFITRLDADDTLAPNFVAAVKAKIATEDSDIVYGNYNLMDFDSRVFSTQRILPRGKSSSTPIHHEPFHGACTVIHRQKLLQHGGYNEAFNRNDGFDLYLKFRNETLSLIEEPIFNYRRGHRSMSSDQDRLFKARVNMIAAYADQQGLAVKDDVLHILAFPSHPDYYSNEQFSKHVEFAKKWGPNTHLIVRDKFASESFMTPWEEVTHYGDLRTFLDQSAKFNQIRRFVVHSMSEPLAPLTFFEVAPLAMDLFESTSLISGEKLECSLYTTVAGGIVLKDNSRILYDEQKTIAHTGGLTAFDRSCPINEIGSLLEICRSMTTSGHVR